MRGIRIEVICGRFVAGESIADLAFDYGLLNKEVEEAIRHQIKVIKGRAPRKLPPRLKR